jgi:eukaryotic-like serine/threonine-protein kinase
MFPKIPGCADRLTTSPLLGRIPAIAQAVPPGIISSASRTPMKDDTSPPMTTIDGQGSVADSIGLADTTVPMDGLQRDVLDTGALQPGQRLGRYVVSGLIGRGGMGMVYAARDPELGRNVALKVLRPPGSARLARHLETRLRREAQALARLSHPSVVAVYDVGVAAGQVFLAMQLVVGTTLDRAIEQARAGGAGDWRQVLGWFVAAGRGLAVAHASGIVHRDFKPANVLIDRDGTVRVGDFGLARGAADESASGDSGGSGSGDGDASSGESDGSLLDAALTRGDQLLGTPLYMAPEQHLRRPAGPAADQFSFCLTLWVALFGRHPFTPPGGGFDAPAAVAAMSLGMVAPRPPRPRLPRRLIRALRRGLSFDPGARFPSMEALLAALAPPPRRRLRVAAAIAGAVAIAVGATLLAVGAGRSAGARCADRAAEELSAVWDSRGAAELATAFATTGRPSSAEVAARVSRGIDRHAARWQALRTETCEAAGSPDRRTAALAADRAACLGQQLEELRVTLGILRAQPTPTLVDGASTTVDELPPAERCADAEVAADAARGNLATRREIGAIRASLAEARTRRAGGEHRTAIAILTPLIGRAMTVGSIALAGKLELELAISCTHGNVAQAAILARLAAEHLTASRVDSGAAEAMDLMVSLAGDRRDAAAVDAILPLARAAAQRAGDARSRADFEFQTGQALSDIARFEEAEASCRRALDIAERELPGSSLIPDSLFCLGRAQIRRGANREALATMSRAVELRRASDGDHSSSLASAMMALALAELKVGDERKARDLLERSLAIREEIYGAESGPVSEVLVNMVQLLDQTGHSAEAKPLAIRALTIREKLYGPTSKAAGLAHYALAQLLAGEDWPQADQHYAIASQILEQHLRPDDPHLGLVAAGWGQGLVDHGDSRRALPLLDRAATQMERVHDPRAGAILSLMGSVATDEGRHDDAVAMLERGLRVVEAGDVGGINLSATRYHMARALARRGKPGDRARALPIVEAACDGLRALGDRGKTLLGSAETLRDELRGRR